MSIDINGVSIPDIPTNLLETYPNYVILFEANADLEQFTLILTTEMITCMDCEVLFEKDPGMIYLVTIPYPYSVYMYNHEYSNEWVLAEQNLEEGTIYFFSNDTANIINPVQSNYDIKISDGTEDESGNLIYLPDPYPITPEIVYITIYEEKYSISSDWIRAIAKQARRLCSIEDKINISTIQTSLENANLDTITITKDGEYTPSDGYIGYNSITVETGFDLLISGDYGLDTISTTATEIRNGAFNSCMYLKSVDAPNATSIGDMAFYFCLLLESANFPLVETIGKEAFSMSGGESLNFPAVTSIEEMSFFTSNITSVSFPKLIEIPKSAFYNASKLVTIEIPLVTTIGYGAFDNCDLLAKIDLPSVTSLDAAFTNCEILETVILRSKTVVQITSSTTNPFKATLIESGTGYIYVPSELVDTYKTTDGWSTYANQFRAIEDYPDICG